MLSYSKWWTWTGVVSLGYKWLWTLSLAFESKIMALKTGINFGCWWKEQFYIFVIPDFSLLTLPLGQHQRHELDARYCHSSPLNLRAVELPKVPQTSSDRVDAETFERDLGTQSLYLYQNGSPPPYRLDKDKIINVWVRASSLYWKLCCWRCCQTLMKPMGLPEVNLKEHHPASFGS